jgi:hypothetical protein
LGTSGGNESIDHVLRAIFADQKCRWQSGERPALEEYVERFPALADNQDALLDLVYHEFVCREAQGETADLIEYQRRFPDLAEQIAEQFALDRGYVTVAGPNQLPPRATVMKKGKRRTLKIHQWVEPLTIFPTANKKLALVALDVAVRRSRVMK